MRGRGGGGCSAGQSASDWEDEDGEEAGEERVSLPPCCWTRKLLQDAPSQSSHSSHRFEMSSLKCQTLLRLLGEVII